MLGLHSTLGALTYWKGIPSTARSFSNFYPLERFLKVEFEVKDEKHFFSNIHVMFCRSTLLKVLATLEGRNMHSGA